MLSRLLGLIDEVDIRRWPLPVARFEKSSSAEMSGGEDSLADFDFADPVGESRG